MPARYVAHLDMDAFYASVELLRRPGLRGRPLVIGGRRQGAPDGAIPTLRGYAGRGVITTATYEARNYGLVAGIELEPIAGSPGARAFGIFLKCFERGLLIRTTGDIIALSPALIIEPKHIEELFAILSQALRD